MDKKGTEYPTVTTVELFILLLIFGMLAYMTVNVDISNEVNAIKSKDLGLAISFIGSNENNVKLTYNFEGERKIIFYDNSVEVSNENGESFQKSGFNLDKKISFSGMDGNYLSLTIKKTGNEMTIK